MIPNKTKHDSKAFRNPSKIVNEFHKDDDVDSGHLAHHHTLGKGANQAAPGISLNYSLRVADVIFSMRSDETDYFKICNGQTLVGNYSELEDQLGSLTLPDLTASLPDPAGNYFMRVK